MNTPFDYEKWKKNTWLRYFGGTVQGIIDENGNLIGLKTAKLPLIPKVLIGCSLACVIGFQAWVFMIKAGRKFLKH